MANCINHSLRRATSVHDGFLICPVCEAYWSAQASVDATHTWDKPVQPWTDAEMDVFQKKMQVVMDIRDKASKRMLEA